MLLLAGPVEAHDDEDEIAGESAGNAALTSAHSDRLNLTLVDSILLEGVTDVYVSGNHAYVGNQERDVLHIVDISQPQAMRLDTSLTLLGTRSVDVKVSGNLAVVGTQSNRIGGAILIDVSEPSNPEILSSFEVSDRGGVHNLFLHKDRAYLASSVDEGLTILDISDRTQPFESSFWMNEAEDVGSFVHDVFIRDDMAFLSVDYRAPSSGGLVILDLADPDHPVTLSSMPIPEGLHSAWMEEGFVYCNQEYGGWGRRLHIIDASDPRHPVEVGVFRAQPPPFGRTAGPHNPYIRDGLLYWAYYNAGVRIFDLATPDRPVEIAYFPTPGAWGAQPHTDGLIYVADNARHVRGIGESALLALRFDEPSHAIRQVSLSADSSIAGRSDWITVTATTMPSPRGITGQISRASARFFSAEETEEWVLLDDVTAADAAGGGERLFAGHIQMPRNLHSGTHRIRVQLEDDHARIYPYDVPFHVLPAEDLVLFGDALAGQWQANFIRGELGKENSVVYRGASALAFRNINFHFRVFFEPLDFIDAFGFASLRFAFHPGDATAALVTNTEITVLINEEVMSLLDGSREGIGVDMDAREWQLIDIPLDLLNLDMITMIGFRGMLRGTFYLDDIRLVAAAPPSPVATAVQEEHTTALPQDFCLEQNYPNPFNSGTVIRFELREKQEVELAVYNLAGQKLVHLVEGSREAGGHTVRWSGRDERGRELASGVYVYRLQAGKELIKTRKMALVR